MYLVYSGLFDALRQRYFHKVLAHLDLTSGATILDFGCGPGDFMLAAKALGIKVMGIDSSPYSLEIARKRGLDVQHGSIRELRECGDKYDAIFVQSVIEHVADGPKLVEELIALLKPGGMLVLSSPTPGPFFWDDPTHVRPYTPKSFRALADMFRLECSYLRYVFAFLLGFEVRAQWFFFFLFVLPVSLGSNVVVFLRRPAQ